MKILQEMYLSTRMTFASESRYRNFFEGFSNIARCEIFSTLWLVLLIKLS